MLLACVSRECTLEHSKTTAHLLAPSAGEDAGGSRASLTAGGVQGVQPLWMTACQFLTNETYVYHLTHYIP